MATSRRINDGTLEIFGCLSAEPLASRSASQGCEREWLTPRGNLALTYLGIVDDHRPDWFVWENVPGVLSSWSGAEPPSDLEEGREWGSVETSDFGCFLAGITELGYGFAYRVLDAQYVRVDGYGRAVPQRRRRVFVVGNSRSWRRAAAVLFERESLSGNSPPRREAGEGVAGTIDASAARSRGAGISPGTITSTGSVAHCLNAGAMGRIDFESETMIAHSLRGEGFDASEDGTGRGTPIIAIQERAVSENLENGPQGKGYQEGIAYTLEARNKVQACCFPINTQIATRHEALGEGTGMGIGSTDDPAFTLQAGHSHAVATGWAVRRLTPTECERLQGFPEIVDRVRIEVCEDAKFEHAQSALRLSQSQRQGSSKPALVHVLINLERSAVEIHRAGKLIWSASTAAHPSASPLSMPLDGFVRLTALMTQIAVPQTLHGRVELPQNTSNSSPRLYGSASVSVSGQETEELAGDAEKFITAAESCMKSITSQFGQHSPNYEQILATLSCCVTAAISSCIPDEIRLGSSYAVIVETSRGYTNISKAADGPRYKALGNSMAVNCMRWIGTRIQMVDNLVSDLAA